MKDTKNEVKDMDMVVKTNRLNMAIQNLSLAEIRLIQIAIADSRELGKGLSADTPLAIHALRFADIFGIDSSNAYKVLKEAEKTLFDRRFTFLNAKDNEVKSRWISQVEYKDGEGSIEIIFTPAVVREITRIDGAEQFFSQYALQTIATLNNMYSIRLYELLNQWKAAKKTPLFQLDVFRNQMGVGINEYTRMSDFKRRVLDLAVDEINDKTDLKVSYTQEKKGRVIVGFKFKVLAKTTKNNKDYDIKADNSDLFTIDNYTDAQLRRITRNPKFIKDYSDRISPSSDLNKDMNLWSAHFVDEIKKDPSKFSKQSFKSYLDY